MFSITKIPVQNPDESRHDGGGAGQDVGNKILPEVEA